jgi:glycerol-3-phosphate dehydrogenase
MRLVQGSHIVVRRRFTHGSGYLLQTDDRRIVFALPFGDFTLIGTTDRPFTGDVSAPSPSPEEIAYLCRAVNVYFRETLTPDEVIWSYAGVRSLQDDGRGRPEDVTRDYALVFDDAPDRPPLLTVYGGKITTFRRLGEDAVGRMPPDLKAGPAWTRNAALPGGEFRYDEIDAVAGRLRRQWPFLAAATALRLVRAYGLRAERILGAATSMDDLGPVFTADLTAAEVRYLMQVEWAETAEDVLWRRTKLGLTASAGEQAALARFMAEASRG